MPADFTTVFSSNQGFGNELGYLKGMESDIVSVSPSRMFTFACPNVNSSEGAVLMFQSRDIDSLKNTITINGRAVAGRIPASPSKDTWNGNVMLIDANTLRASGNQLQIQSLNEAGTGGGDIDDFILDNVVVMYKTR